MATLVNHQGAGTHWTISVMACRLTTLIAKPMQLTIVSADPTYALGAVAALSAENCGESPATAKPQTTRKAANPAGGSR